MGRLVEFFLGDYVEFETFKWFSRVKGRGELVNRKENDPNEFIVEFINDIGEKELVNVPCTDLRLINRGKQVFHDPSMYLIPPKPKKKKTDCILWSDEVSSSSIRKLPRKSYIVPADPLPSKFISSNKIVRKGFNQKRGRY